MFSSVCLSLTIKLNKVVFYMMHFFPFFMRTSTIHLFPFSIIFHVLRIIFCLLCMLPTFQLCTYHTFYKFHKPTHKHACNICFSPCKVSCFELHISSFYLAGNVIKVQVRTMQFRKGRKNSYSSERNSNHYM